MRSEKNVLEWVVFGVSLVLIAGVLAVLVGAAMRRGDEPPRLAIETGAAVREGQTYRVPVRVANTGDTTAEQARVEVSLVVEGRVVEQGEVLLTFVPRGSVRRGWVTFRRDPACCVVVSRTVGLAEP
jgi:uncharacterized protein (TIGR02588 family)